VKLMPRTRGGALWRFALAAVLVVGFSAGTTAVAGLLQVNNIVTALNLTLPLKNARVTLPPPGSPETLLLIGSDHRASAGTNYRHANTDTMMLIRIDDSSQTINLLSIPRDLRVLLPEGGVQVPDRLNAAYSIGGPNLLIKTLQTQVFPGLQVNHILDVNFKGFSDLIDAIGCVYADVDHRYYNDTAITGFSSIDIRPGYQKLCGDNQAATGALAFVRFRHTDSDIVRNARQQDFVRWVKQGYSTNQLLNDEGKLTHIFGLNVQTDKFLHTDAGVIDLFDLIINADKLTLKSIPFPAVLANCNAGGQTPCYVTADSASEARTYHAFITPTAAPAAKPPPVAPAAPAKRRRKAAGPPPPPTSGLTPDLADGKSQSSQLGRIAFPVYYPKLIQDSSRYSFSITANCDDPEEPQSAYIGAYPRKYLIHAPGGGRHPSYVFTLEINSALGEFYTVQGTTWRHPPILNSPTKVEVVGGKKLFEYLNGGKISLVAFHTPQAVYWITNTLADQIPNSQMIGMAASLTPAG
jgi:LCP family protein required for cell wall assembly